MVSRLPDLNRPCCQVALSLVHNAFGIRHDGIVDENVKMILRSQKRADVAMQRKIGLLGALDGLSHLRVSGMHQISHLATHLLLPERRASECIHRCGSQSGMYSCRDDTTNPGPSARAHRMGLCITKSEPDPRNSKIYNNRQRQTTRHCVA